MFWLLPAVFPVLPAAHFICVPLQHTHSAQHTHIGTLLLSHSAIIDFFLFLCVWRRILLLCCCLSPCRTAGMCAAHRETNERILHIHADGMQSIDQRAQTVLTMPGHNQNAFSPVPHELVRIFRMHKAATAAAAIQMVQIMSLASLVVALSYYILDILRSLWHDFRVCATLFGGQCKYSTLFNWVQQQQQSIHLLNRYSLGEVCDIKPPATVTYVMIFFLVLNAGAAWMKFCDWAEINLRSNSENRSGYPASLAHVHFVHFEDISTIGIASLQLWWLKKIRTKNCVTEIPPWGERHEPN